MEQNVNVTMYGKISIVFLAIFGQCFGGFERIIGGSQASDGKYPYMAFLSVTNDKGNPAICGGAIITKRTILTAAHCFNDCTKCDTNVTVGTNRRDLGGTLYKSASVVYPTEYKPLDTDRPRPYDIALVRLTADIIFTDKVKAIPIEYGAVAGGVSAVLAGWGSTAFPSSPVNVLQEITLQTVTNTECQVRSPSVIKILGSHVCTFTKVGEGSCQGDSGGPLVAGGKVFGIVSSGIPCGKGYPDFYTRVSSHTAWIDKNKI